MKKTLRFTLASILFAGLLVGCASSSTSSSKGAATSSTTSTDIAEQGILDTQETNTLAYQSASSLSVLANVAKINNTLSVKSRSHHYEEDEITSEQKAEIEKLLPVADLYSAGINFLSEVSESDREGYDIKQVISFDTMTAGSNYYTLYYNIDYQKTITETYREYVDGDEVEEDEEYDDFEFIKDWWTNEEHEEYEHNDYHDDYDDNYGWNDDYSWEDYESDYEQWFSEYEDWFYGNHDWQEEDFPSEEDSSTDEETETSSESSVETQSVRPHRENDVVSEEVITSEESSEEETSSTASTITITETYEETHFSGITVIDEAEYPFEGSTTKEVGRDESEEEMEFVISTAENSFVKVKQEIEVEDGESSEEYKYSVVENGEKTYSFKFEKEIEEDESTKTEIKLTIDDVKYKFAFFTIDEVEYIKVKVDEGRDEYAVTYRKVTSTAEDGTTSVSYEEVVKDSSSEDSNEETVEESSSSEEIA